jgi:hypothetical protein
LVDQYDRDAISIRNQPSLIAVDVHGVEFER